MKYTVFATVLASLIAPNMASLLNPNIFKDYQISVLDDNGIYVREANEGDIVHVSFIGKRKRGYVPMDRFQVYFEDGTSRKFAEKLPEETDPNGKAGSGYKMQLEIPPLRSVRTRTADHYLSYLKLNLLDVHSISKSWTARNLIVIFQMEFPSQ